MASDMVCKKRIFFSRPEADVSRLVAFDMLQTADDIRSMAVLQHILSVGFASLNSPEESHANPACILNKLPQGYRESADILRMTCDRGNS